MWQIVKAELYNNKFLFFLGILVMVLLGFVNTPNQSNSAISFLIFSIAWFNVSFTVPIIYLDNFRKKSMLRFYSMLPISYNKIGIARFISLTLFIITTAIIFLSFYAFNYKMLPSLSWIKENLKYSGIFIMFISAASINYDIKSQGKKTNIISFISSAILILIELAVGLNFFIMLLNKKAGIIYTDTVKAGKYFRPFMSNVFIAVLTIVIGTLSIIAFNKRRSFLE